MHRDIAKGQKEVAQYLKKMGRRRPAKLGSLLVGEGGKEEMSEDGGEKDVFRKLGGEVSIV